LLETAKQHPSCYPVDIDKLMQTIEDNKVLDELIATKGFDVNKIRAQVSVDISANLKSSEGIIVAGLNWPFLFGDDPSITTQYLTAFYGHSSEMGIAHKVDVAKSVLDSKSVNQDELEIAIQWIAIEGEHMEVDVDKVIPIIKSRYLQTLHMSLMESNKDVVILDKQSILFGGTAEEIIFKQDIISESGLESTFQIAYKERLLHDLTNVNKESFNVLLQIDLAMRLIHVYQDDTDIHKNLINLIRKVVTKNPEYLYHYSMKSLNEYSYKIRKANKEEDSDLAKSLAERLLKESEVLSTCNVRASESDFEDQEDYLLTPMIDNILSSMKDISYRTLFPKLFRKIELSQYKRDNCTPGNVYCNSIKQNNVAHFLSLLDGENLNPLIRDENTGLIHVGDIPEFLPVTESLSRIVGFDYDFMAAHKYPSRLMELIAAEDDTVPIINRLAEMEAGVDTVDTNQILEFIKSRHDTNKARIYVKDKTQMIEMIKTWIGTVDTNKSVKLNNIYMREQAFTMDDDGERKRQDIDKKNLDLSIGEVFDDTLPSEAGKHVSRAIHLHFEMDIKGQDYPLMFEVQISTEDLRRDHLLFEALYHGNIRVAGNPDAESYLI